MKLLSLIIFITLVLNSTAHSQEAEKDAVPLIPGKSEGDPADFKASYTLQPIGFGPAPVLSQGLGVGIFLKPHMILSFEMTYGPGVLGNLIYGMFSSEYSRRQDADGKSSYSASKMWDRPEIEALTTGVHLKWFVTKTMYVKGGIDYRNIEKTDTYLGTSDGYSVSFKGDGFSAAVAIGHQWQRRRFTIGCDWIGYVQPIASRVISETTTGTVHQYGRDILRDGEQAYLRSASLELVRFYLGLSF